jgi:predicted acyltransferase
MYIPGVMFIERGRDNLLDAPHASVLPEAPAASLRLVSLDALRGFDMFWIIGGSEVFRGFVRLWVDPLPPVLARQLDHAEWIGLTAWDLIMPLFLFLVGVSMSFSFARRMAQNEGRATVWRHVAKRFALLFLLGIVIDNNLLAFDLSNLHLYSNTLQAIACGYLAASVIMQYMGILGQELSCLVTLVLYGALLAWVPVPGHAAGLLAPDCNLALYVDDMLLGRFRDGTPYTYVLSSIGFSATVLLGVLAGHVLKAPGKRPSAKAAWLAAGGIAGLAAGEFLSLWQPVIKHIWTSSFVLLAGGWSAILLALFYWIIDVQGVRRWAFVFVVIGSNALAVYTATEVAGNYLTGDPREGAVTLPAWLHFILALGVFACIWSVLYALYRKRIFLKV